MKNFAVSAVVGMGLLIIIVTVFIIYGLVQKSDNPDFKFFDLATESVPQEPAPTAAPSSAAATTLPQTAPANTQSPSKAATALGDLRFEIPFGYRAVGTDTSSNRLIIQLENDQGETRLMMIDLNTGAKLGTITLAPPPAQP